MTTVKVPLIFQEITGTHVELLFIIIIIFKRKIAQKDCHSTMVKSIAGLDKR